FQHQLGLNPLARGKDFAADPLDSWSRLLIPAFLCTPFPIPTQKTSTVGLEESIVEVPVFPRRGQLPMDRPPDSATPTNGLQGGKPLEKVAEAARLAARTCKEISARAPRGWVRNERFLASWHSLQPPATACLQLPCKETNPRSELGRS